MPPLSWGTGSLISVHLIRSERQRDLFVTGNRSHAIVGAGVGQAISVRLYPSQLRWILKSTGQVESGREDVQSREE